MEGTIADCVRHGDRATGDRLGPWDVGLPVLHLDPHRPEQVSAVRGAGGGDGVSDEGHPFAGGGKGEAEHSRVNVVAIGDEFAEDLLPVEGGADDPGVAVVQGPHAVVKVSGDTRPGVDGRQGGGIGRLGVANGGDGARVDDSADQIGRAR